MEERLELCRFIADYPYILHDVTYDADLIQDGAKPRVVWGCCRAVSQQARL